MIRLLLSFEKILVVLATHLLINIDESMIIPEVSQ
jgi:hypothetical protein